VRQQIKVTWWTGVKRWALALLGETLGTWAEMLGTWTAGLKFWFFRCSGTGGTKPDLPVIISGF
jgi:hypothetical protein